MGSVWTGSCFRLVAALVSSHMPSSCTQHRHDSSQHWGCGQVVQAQAGTGPAQVGEAELPQRAAGWLSQQAVWLPLPAGVSRGPSNQLVSCLRDALRTLQHGRIRGGPIQLTEHVQVPFSPCRACLPSSAVPAARCNFCMAAPMLSAGRRARGCKGDLQVGDVRRLFFGMGALPPRCWKVPAGTCCMSHATAEAVISSIA